MRPPRIAAAGSRATLKVQVKPAAVDRGGGLLVATAVERGEEESGWCGGHEDYTLAPRMITRG